MSPINTKADTEKERYQALKAGFIRQGTTLTEWCRCNGTYIQNVRDAVFGRWCGPKASKLLIKVEKAAGGIK